MLEGDVVYLNILYGQHDKAVSVRGTSTIKLNRLCSKEFHFVHLGSSQHGYNRDTPESVFS